ncbi:MAG: oxygen-dependent coproporphyrinogen oxidase [Puniceicoccales bacterium]
MPDPNGVENAFRVLQNDLCHEIESREKNDVLIEDSWDRTEGGGGTSRAIQGGEWIEKGGINFSRIRGSALPAPASARRPEYAGRPFEAMGVSVVLHPRNPYAPTAHMNVRAFFILPSQESESIQWWFGGGFDLTPCYGFDEDAIDWHKTAHDVCENARPGLYRRFKRECDSYFYLPHRHECRGIGGIFYDDFSELGFDTTFRFSLAVGHAFREAFFRILDRRAHTPFEERQREFQRLRHGRYVEFNLLHDRGTKFGLASGGRTESILMSMPADASWSYNWKPESGSPEAQLTERYLQPRDWLAPNFPLETNENPS